MTLEDVASVSRETGSSLLEDSVPRKTQRRRANVYGLLACQGDSLTFGSRDPDGMSYPLYLGRLLSQKHGQTWAAVNFAVPRDGWAEIWRRNYHELLSVPEAKRSACGAGPTTPSRTARWSRPWPRARPSSTNVASRAASSISRPFPARPASARRWSPGA